MLILLTFLIMIMLLLASSMIIARTDAEDAIFEQSYVADTGKCRKTRWQISSELIQYYNIGNVDTRQLEKYLKRYKSVRTESEEILWETEWIPLMHRYLDAVDKEIPNTKRNAYLLEKTKFEANEAKLSKLRERKLAIADRQHRTQKQPYIFLRIIANIIKQASKRMSEKENDETTTTGQR